MFEGCARDEAVVLLRVERPCEAKVERRVARLRSVSAGGRTARRPSAAWTCRTLPDPVGPCRTRGGPCRTRGGPCRTRVGPCRTLSHAPPRRRKRRHPELVVPVFEEG